jgi:hypothetical protein
MPFFVMAASECLLACCALLCLRCALQALGGAPHVAARPLDRPWPLLAGIQANSCARDAMTAQRCQQVHTAGCCAGKPGCITDSARVARQELQWRRQWYGCATDGRQRAVCLHVLLRLPPAHGTKHRACSARMPHTGWGCNCTHGLVGPRHIRAAHCTGWRTYQTLAEAGTETT